MHKRPVKRNKRPMTDKKLKVELEKLLCEIIARKSKGRSALTVPVHHLAFILAMQNARVYLEGE